MAATWNTSVGFPLWHYNVSLLVVGLLAFPLWPLLQRRRVVTLGMAYGGALATLTGFVMLYTKEFARKEWLTWWHSVTSFVFLGLFLVHWAHNQPRLSQFTRKVARGLPQGAAAGSAWTAGIVLGVFAWSPDGRGLFTRENYILVSTWTIWWGIALTWGIWLWHRRDAWRARLARPAYRNTARALVDTSLFLACWGALITGFLLLYLPAWFDASGLKYVSKWSHTATSVLLLMFVALHIGFNARLVQAHATRVDDELARRNV